jgi:hypothetical protein
VPPKSGRVEIVNSTLSGNAAGGSGAAVNNTSNGTVSILAGSRVVDNPGEMIPDPAQVIDPLDPEPIEYIPAPGVYAPSAGAITNQGTTDTVGTIRIADSTVSGNFATQNGAGILNDGAGILVVERSTITDNSTEAGGGGLHTTGGAVTVSDSTFRQRGARRRRHLQQRLCRQHRPAPALYASGRRSGNTAHASGGGMLNGGRRSSRSPTSPSRTTRRTTPAAVSRPRPVERDDTREFLNNETTTRVVARGSAASGSYRSRTLYSTATMPGAQPELHVRPIEREHRGGGACIPRTVRSLSQAQLLR